MLRESVEDTLNSLLDAEADQLCKARRYERSADRVSTRAGSYERKLHTTAGEVKLKMPKLRSVPFETAIIERYRRRESRHPAGVQRQDLVVEALAERVNDFETLPVRI
jgi:transposase-like protein